MFPHRWCGSSGRKHQVLFASLQPLGRAFILSLCMGHASFVNFHPSVEHILGSISDLHLVSLNCFCYVPIVFSLPVGCVRAIAGPLAPALPYLALLALYCLHRQKDILLFSVSGKNRSKAVSSWTNKTHDIASFFLGEPGWRRAEIKRATRKRHMGARTAKDQTHNTKGMENREDRKDVDF